MLHLMKSLLGIVEMVLLEDLIRHSGDLLLLKGEKERKGGIIAIMVVRSYSNALR
jgi:hypothetical protein